VEGEEWKMALRIQYSLFKTLVMLFGLTNVPASYQKFIKDILHPFLDLFCTAFLNNILIYSDNLMEY
jgi:hypothetical protein